jgi:nicotinate-nucleotide adenylyltransferase
MELAVANPSTARPRRIGIYGGSFDPVHNGHLVVARELLRSFALDQVLFVPAFAAPHKRRRIVTPALYRYAMLVLATRRDEMFRVSTVELDAPDHPYTVDTLVTVRRLEGPEPRLFFIMGADSWTEIDGWRDYERMLGLSDHIVVTRPEFSTDTRHVSRAIRERVVDVRGFDRRSICRWLDHNPGPNIFFTDVAYTDVSATSIRKLARDGPAAELKTLMPTEVYDFIEKYGLYK